MEKEVGVEVTALQCGILVSYTDAIGKYAARCIDHRRVVYFKTEESAIKHQNKFPYHLVQQISRREESNK